MKTSLIIIIVSLIFGALSVNAEQIIILRASEAQALQLALQSYKRNQRTKFEGKPIYGDLRHYSIHVKRQPKSLEIVFLPDKTPLKANEAGTGGGTAYGWEIHYDVSVDGTRILNEHFAK